MGKFVPLLVALALFGTARCYSSDPEAVLADVPIVGAMISPPQAAPAYVAAIGTPAASGLPEGDVAAWFNTPEDGDELDVARWSEVDQFLGHISTPAHWAEACKKAGAAAGGERAGNARLAALACSDDGTMTQLQRFAALVLSAQARTALYIKGAPGASIAAIQSRQSEIRLACAYGIVARQMGGESAFREICDKASDESYIAGDTMATFVALGEAYALVADEVARLDPTVDAEPGFFGNEGDAP